MTEIDAANYPFTGLERHLGIREVEAPRISVQSAHEVDKVVSLTCRLLIPPGDIPGTRSSYRLSRPQGHSVAGRIKSVKNLNELNRN